MPLKANEEQYWQTYLENLQPSESPETLFVTTGYAGGPEITDRLLRLYLEGTKTAGSSLLEDFLTANDPVPQVGNYWICLASDGEPGCILRTMRIETHKFKDIPDQVAIAEGEGDSSVAYWKRVHAELYAPHLKAWGLSQIDEATVITEFFRLSFVKLD